VSIDEAEAGVKGAEMAVFVLEYADETAAPTDEIWFLTDCPVLARE
jgi:hypothetical protein